MSGAKYSVVGAGPAGLVAAATLARADRNVVVYEKSDVVGHRFAGDFDGLEHWSVSAEFQERLSALGVLPTFDHRPFSKVTFYDSDLRPTVARSDKPLFTLVRRGPSAGSLDRALLDQARAAGATVQLGVKADRASPGDVIAIGPRYADGIAAGYTFRTDLEDQAHCIVSDRLAPAGYAYLLIWGHVATVATCLFDHHRDWKRGREETVRSFQKVVHGLELVDARPFTGFGSVLSRSTFVDEAGHLFAGEAAGLQDPEWGFGMWYAMESGWLAARSLIEGFDYSDAAHARFDARREAALFNRVLYEQIPRRLRGPLLRQGARSRDVRGRLIRHWKPTRFKSRALGLVGKRFLRERLAHRDRACHSGECDCVWCTHGASHSLPGTDDRGTHRSREASS